MLININNFSFILKDFNLFSYIYANFSANRWFNIKLLISAIPYLLRTCIKLWKTVQNLQWQCPRRTSVLKMVLEIPCRWLWSQRHFSIRKANQQWRRQNKGINWATSGLRYTKDCKNNFYHSTIHDHLKRLEYINKLNI